jgi:molybdenum cofactor biosynthesis protein B
VPGGRIDPTLTFTPLGIAVLTVSDSRDAATDTSGDLLAGRIVASGHRLAARALVRDSKADIQQQLRRWIEDPDVDIIISTGGTGLTGRDVTPEAVRELFEK